MGNALAAGHRLAPELPETLIPRLRNRNHGVFLHRTNPRIGVALNNTARKIT